MIVRAFKTKDPLEGRRGMSVRSALRAGRPIKEDCFQEYLGPTCYEICCETRAGVICKKHGFDCPEL